MMERKATKPGVSRLSSDLSNPVIIPIEGKAKYRVRVRVRACVT